MKTFKTMMGYFVIFTASVIVGIVLLSMFHIKPAQDAVYTIVGGREYSVQLNDKNEPVDLLDASEVPMSWTVQIPDGDVYHVQAVQGYRMYQPTFNPMNGRVL